jgi:5'-deoxynucleotidase YfbR-like HD superfamily hydrolase
MTNKILPKIFTTLHQLSSVDRYSRDFMLNRESVLEHTGFCSIFALYLAKQIEKHHNVTIRYDILMIRTAVHDIDETVTGDVSRTTKYWNKGSKEFFSFIEKESVLKLSTFLGIDIYDDWDKAKNSSLEGVILKIVDMGSVVYKIWNEVILLNNLAFLRVAEEAANFISELGANIPKDDPRTDSCSMFLREVLLEFRLINSSVLDMHKDLLENNRDMLYSFPDFKGKDIS